MLKNIIRVGGLTASIGVAWGQFVSERDEQLYAIFDDISNLVNNFTGMKFVGIAAAILMVLIKIIDHPKLGKPFSSLGPIWKRIVITLFGQIGGVFMGMNKGMGIVDAIIFGLLTSGGAVALWEAIKPIWEKVAPK